MSNPKLKSENYQNLGGINLKASPYLTGPQEFLNLVNFDFQTPGSLTKRWGSTQYFTQSYTGTINTFYEYNKLDGSSYLMLGVSGGLYAGATNGQLTGLSFSYAVTGGTFLTSYGGIDWVYNGFTATVEFVSAYAVFPDGAGVGVRGGFIAGSGGFVNIANVQNTNKLSMVTINNWVFGADGNVFFKYDGVTTSFYGLPLVLPSSSAINTSNYTGTTTSTLLPNYDYRFAFSFVNRRGFEGPVTVCAAIQSGLNATGGTFGFKAATLPISVPSGFDISKINYYISYSTGTSSTAGIYPTTYSDAFNRTYYLAKTVDVTSGASIAQIDLGVQWNNSSGLDFPTWTPVGYVFKGMTYYTALGSTNYIQFKQDYFAPKYLEIYNNQLMMAGFTGSQSTVWFSDVGEPEGILPENNFEVRTNDGDVITGMRSYQSALMIFKNNSYHQLSGDDPANFTLRQVSDVYGCANHRSIAVYEDYLVFLDRKGIIRHNGANQETISAKIQDVFDSMNYEAAKNVACMVHDKKRNQILTAIPINGATLNNITVVYDYLVNAWTKYDGFQPSLFSVLTGNLSSRSLFYGGLTGNVYSFGASFMGDNGAGFTALFKTRYLSELGHSVEKQYRRLYVDCDNSAGASSIFNIEMMPSFQNTVGFTASMTASAYQSRIDFGLSTKALAFQLATYSATFATKIHGYVLEYRHQRNV